MNKESLKETCRKMTTNMLQEELALLEFDRMECQHYGKTLEAEKITLVMDAICGELIIRDKSARNSSEPKWNIPKCPDTAEQLLMLGDGSIL